MTIPVKHSLDTNFACQGSELEVPKIVVSSEPSNKVDSDSESSISIFATDLSLAQVIPMRVSEIENQSTKAVISQLEPVSNESMSNPTELLPSLTVKSRKGRRWSRVSAQSEISERRIGLPQLESTRLGSKTFDTNITIDEPQLESTKRIKKSTKGDEIGKSNITPVQKRKRFVLSSSNKSAIEICVSNDSLGNKEKASIGFRLNSSTDKFSGIPDDLPSRKRVSSVKLRRTSQEKQKTQQSISDRNVSLVASQSTDKSVAGSNKRKLEQCPLESQVGSQYFESLPLDGTPLKKR